MQLTTNKTDRKERPIARGVLDYFPLAIAEVANVSFVGNQQHNPGEPMHWAKGKSADHADCIARHLIERGTTDDDGLRHSAKAAWRALALLQTEIEDDAENQCNCTAADPCPNGKTGSETRCVVFFADDRRAAMYAKLVSLGCPAEVALQIANGTTFSDARPELDPRFVYVAGPMRGYEKFNFPAFDAARDAMLAKGFHVISPADIDRVTEKDAEDPSKVDVTDQSRFVLRDFWAVFFLKKSGDFNGIVLLDKWFKSTGASSEFGLGKWLDLRFYESDGSGYYFANDGRCPKDFTPENHISHVGSMDGDWDWQPAGRGVAYFYRVRGGVVKCIQYLDGIESPSGYTVETFRAYVVNGTVTRLSSEEIVQFTKRANENQ